MKQLIIILLAITTIFSFSSCKKVTGEGPVESQQRSINNFLKISSSISGKVNFTVAPEYKLQVVAQRNILDVLETNKEGNELVIKFRNGVNVGNHEEITINIQAPYIDGFNLSGSGNLDVFGNIVTPQLNLRVSGSGNITLQNAQVENKLEGTISGSGNLRVLSGSASSEDLRISGSGDIDLALVEVENSNTQISGSGTAKVNVSDKLDVSVSGSGNVYYFGNPIINSHISGSGKVLPL